MRANVFLREHTTKKGETRFTLIVREYGRQDKSILLGPISRKVAKQRRVEVLNELLQGSFKREPTIHLYFSEMVEKFFSDYGNSALAPKTVLCYRGSLTPALKRFSGYRLNQITRHDVESLIADLKVGNRTKNLCLCAIRAVFKKAVEWDYVNTSPALDIKKLPESPNGSRALTPNELSQIWEGMSSWQKSLFQVTLNTGMRPGELSNFKWKDVDWGAKSIAIANDRTRRTKNGKTRYIPMNQELQDELLFLWDNLAEHSGAGTVHPREPHQREYVFCHPDGSKVVNFDRAIRSVFKRHGIKGVTPHGLRKTFCTQLARSNVHPRVAQQLMGHSDMNLTMKVYTQIDDGQLRDAVNALPTSHQLRRSKLKLVANNS